MKYLIVWMCLGMSLYAVVPTPPKPSTPVSLPKLPQTDDKELSWVDEQVRLILPSRLGVSENLINSLRDPMRVHKKERNATLVVIPVPLKMFTPPAIKIAKVPKVIKAPSKIPPIVIKSTVPSKTLLPPPNVIKSPSGENSVITPIVEVEEPLRLRAVMNYSALINGKWYKVGDSIHSYVLTEVKATSVVLNDPKKGKKVLMLNPQNANIQIITR